MKHFRVTFICLSVAALFAHRVAYAQPTSVAGDSFVLVATNSTSFQLACLAADDLGNIYSGNNANGPGIPLQRFKPATFSNTPVQLENFGPVCDDADGLTFGHGYLYAASLQGVRRISRTNGSSTLFIPGVAANGSGSPLVFRASDGHFFVGRGAFDGTGVDEYDPSGSLVRNHTTTAEVETMTFDPASGLIYYAPFGSDVRSFNPTNDSDTLIATINGTIDAGLTFDTLSHRLFVGTANGSNSGKVYTIDPTSRVVTLFATGFQGSLGIFREPTTGDLYFLEEHNLYRLNSASVANGLAPKLSIWTAIELGWPSDTNLNYQVQWRSQLDSNTWFNLGSPIRGNGTTNFTFDSTRTNSQRFYRLVITP